MTVLGYDRTNGVDYIGIREERAVLPQFGRNSRGVRGGWLGASDADILSWRWISCVSCSFALDGEGCKLNHLSLSLLIEYRLILFNF